MNITLKTIDIDKIVNHLLEIKIDSSPLIIQYADFNVLNYFYENNFNSDELSNFFLYPDSSAIHFYLKYFLKKRSQINISTDLQDNLLKEINKNHFSVFLFGDLNSILQRAKENILLKYSSTQIIGSCNGYNYDTKDVVTKVNENKIDILFIGLGVGRQEKWIIENYNKLDVKVIMSVGGWFQYLADNKKRAPMFLRKMHLEWLHKLAKEFPRVWKRYLVGVPKFYIRLLTKKINIEIIDG